MEMFVVSSGFIGNFKIGDNINYNLEILSMLYNLRRNSDSTQRNLYNKLIIILIVSITEAFLYDFHTRCRKFTWEGVINITTEFLDSVRSQKMNKFRSYIDHAERHDLFGDPSSQLYRELVELTKLRNRVHIQNQNNDLEADDARAFNNTRMVLAEKCLERVVKILSSRHPRKPYVSGYVSDFVLPWDEHFPSM